MFVVKYGADLVFTINFPNTVIIKTRKTAITIFDATYLLRVLISIAWD
jgi:hypothetical protein